MNVFAEGDEGDCDTHVQVSVHVEAAARSAFALAMRKSSAATLALRWTRFRDFHRLLLVMGTAEEKPPS